MTDWERRVARWAGAGIIDAETADRIRGYERGEAAAARTRWAVWLALLFGAGLLGAGVLLLVSARWYQVPPMARLALLAALPAVFHAGGAFTERWSPRLTTALHIAGSFVLGPAILLGGEVLHLHAHWPRAVLLWTAGAGVAWAVRRDTPHFAALALLVPAWLLAEWAALSDVYDLRMTLAGQSGALLLALTYLASCTGRPGLVPATPAGGDRRVALQALGAIAFLPAALALGVQAGFRLAPAPASAGVLPLPPVPLSVHLLAWAVALAVPVGAAAGLRRRAAWPLLAAAAWVLVLASLPAAGGRLPLYAWLAAGALAVAAWGVREGSPALINLATASFALLVLFFYFDNLLDKLGRSASLIALGLLFLVGGYTLERIRRRMLARAGGGPS